MAAVPREPGSEPAVGARFFCTAGRGLEPFLMREVRARLAATQVEYISGKVFFTTCSDLNMLKKLKSAERLFLLIKKEFPFNVSSVSKGKIYNEMQRLINDDPESWLNAISIWKNLLELDAKKEKLSQRDANPLKRNMGENDIFIAKKLKTEEMQEIQENREYQLEKQIEETLEQGDFITKREKSQEEDSENDVAKVADAHNQSDLTFRVSCRCSGAVAKAFTAQEVGRVMGIALRKQFGWKADLRNPNLEIFIHLNDIYSVVGIPVFRVPLASRAYIRTAGLRSTMAWAMASLAEIKAGAFVLDPMCGLGTILLEAAKEWPDVYYVGADVSDSQLLGACDNLKAASLKDKIELLKVSVIELPLPSESVDIIISDIPFGKKFKLGKDIKSILQEMERKSCLLCVNLPHFTDEKLEARKINFLKITQLLNNRTEFTVLRIGGTAVLLLSEDHRRHLRDGEGSSVPVRSRGGHTAEPGGEKCLNPEEKPGLLETASCSSEASNQDCLDKMPPFGSLVPVECYKVSLGRTGAFICKYKKSQSWTMAGSPL